MKRIVSLFLALAVSATLVFVVTSSKHRVTTVHAQGVCSVATLTGNYGFAFSGFQLQSPGPGVVLPKGSTVSVPFYGEGLITFDGAGNFSNAFTFSENSVPYVTSTASFTGTYTVNADCTGATTAAPGSGGDNIAFVIVKGGAEAFATDISAPDTLNAHLIKQ